MIQTQVPIRSQSQFFTAFTVCPPLPQSDEGVRQHRRFGESWCRIWRTQMIAARTCRREGDEVSAGRGTLRFCKRRSAARTKYRIFGAFLPRGAVAAPFRCNWPVWKG